MKTNRKIRYSFFGIALSALILAGCIRDSQNCTTPSTNLYITVSTDTSEGSSDNVERATVYLFDAQGRFVVSTEVSGSDIEQGLPITLPVRPDSRSRAVVWGNLLGAQMVTEPQPGMSMEEVLITLRQNADGYAAEPDPLFYGVAQLTGERDEYVVIRPKTARLNVTAKGLAQPADADDYYFTVESGYHGYDFTGSPAEGQNTMKLTGAFEPDGDLVTRSYETIHYPASGSRAGTESATVNLWRVNPAGADFLLASADSDTAGRPIRPEAGKTTNVLIYFTSGGGMQIEVVVTDWDEVYQWNEW